MKDNLNPFKSKGDSLVFIITAFALQIRNVKFFPEPVKYFKVTGDPLTCGEQKGLSRKSSSVENPGFSV